MPLISILNLFFMFWIVVGGVVTIYLLYRENEQLTAGESMLYGAFSGLLGAAVFALVTAISVLRIPTERFIEAMERVQAFFPDVQGEMAGIIHGNQFKVIVLLILGAFVLLAIPAGAVGALVGRLLFRQRRLSHRDE